MYRGYSLRSNKNQTLIKTYSQHPQSQQFCKIWSNFCSNNCNLSSSPACPLEMDSSSDIKILVLKLSSSARFRQHDDDWPSWSEQPCRAEELPPQHSEDPPEGLGGGWQWEEGVEVGLSEDGWGLLVVVISWGRGALCLSSPNWTGSVYSL